MKNTKATPEMDKMLRLAGSASTSKALAAQHEVAKALELPLRQGVLYGNIYSDIFESVNFENGEEIVFPVDFLVPGTEKNFVAYSIPNHGRIPERHVESSQFRIGTYEIGSSIDMLLKYVRDARWDVVGRAMRVLEASFVKKINDDAFHTLLAAAVARNIVVYDSVAAPGTFTKRLISLMQQVMRRNAGGNTASVNVGRLTDIYLSPEAVQDVRNWSTADVDEFTRREIFTSPNGELLNIFNTNLHEMLEFGNGQQYQNYYLNDLGATLPNNDLELVLGLDLGPQNSGSGTFIMPIRDPLQIWEDDTMHRQRRVGWYGTMELGMSVLDVRKTIIGSL